MCKVLDPVRSDPETEKYAALSWAGCPLPKQRFARGCVETYHFSAWFRALLIAACCCLPLALSGCVAHLVNEETTGTLVASPGTLAFGALSVGQTTSSNVSLVNQGTAAVRVTQVSVTGQPFSLSGASDLPITVPAGGTYKVNVNFSPAAAGAATGQLMIASNDPSNGTMVISLSGSGAAAAGTTTLSSLGCASSALLGSTTDTCTVTMNEAAGSGGVTVSLASNNSALTLPSVVTVPAGATSVGFTATASSVSTAQTVTLTATASGVSETFNLELGAAAPALSVNATSVAFGTVLVNTAAAPQSVTLASTGAAPVTISGAMLMGAGFSVSGTAFPVTLSPGQATTLNVDFDPTSVGTSAGQLTIASNSSTSSSAVVSLSGTGTATPAALSALSCNSGAMTGSGTDACTVTLSSAAPGGGLIVNLSSSSSAVAVPSSVTVPAGAASVGFTATVSSVATAQAVTVTAGAGGMVTTFTLQLNAAILALTINATSVAFGEVQVNTPATQAVTMTSTGTMPVTVSGATLTGAGFTLPGAAFPATLNPGQTSTLNIEFDPPTAGSATGQLTIASNSSTNGTAVIGLTGTGTPATAPTYYVSNSGSDSNNGTRPQSPWLTIAKVNSSTISAGSQVHFESSGVWHEELIASSGVSYGAYGTQAQCTLSTMLVASCTNMPIIDGADIVTGWVQFSGATYRAPYSATASKGFVDSLYAQTTPLALQTSISNVTSSAGSINSDGSYVYVHLSDGSSPANHLIEVSGSRPYGVYLNGAANTTLDGIEIIRTAKSGYLNYGKSGTGANNVIENSVLFNIGDSLSDPNLYGPIEAAIFAVSIFPVGGFTAQNNWVGEMDFPHNSPNFTANGIASQGVGAPQIIGNEVATVNRIAIMVSDYFGTGSCATPLIEENEMVNSEGNVYLAGCPNAIIEHNTVHDSYGNGFESSTGIANQSDLSTGEYLGFNKVWNLRSAYSNTLYNCIDVNYVANGTATSNSCANVANDDLTLEADHGPSSGWQVYDNSFDASQNVYVDGTEPTNMNRVYPFYIRDTSLAGGLTMQANALVVNAASPYIKFGATSASDQTHDLAQPAFNLVCPSCEIASAP